MSGPVTFSGRASTPPASHRRRTAAVLWRIIALVVLVAYNTWVWTGPVNAHVLITNGFLSELSASDQPHNLFFRIGDALTAVLVALVGVVALRRWPTWAEAWGMGRSTQLWWQTAAAFLLLFAVSTGLDAISVMDCSPTLSPVCATAEQAGTLSWAHYLHTGTSVGAQIGILGSMIAAAVAAQTRVVIAARRRHLWVIAVIETVALALMMIMLIAGIPGLGYPQAVMVLLASVWFAIAAVSLAGGPPPIDVSAGLRRARDRP